MFDVGGKMCTSGDLFLAMCKKVEGGINVTING